MSAEDLPRRLTELREEAHRLSKEKLAANAPNPARLQRAQELAHRLEGLRGEIAASPQAQRAPLTDTAQVANRYLTFLLTEAAAAAPETVRDRAASLHNAVLAAARAVTEGKLADPERTRRTGLATAARLGSAVHRARSAVGRAALPRGRRRAPAAASRAPDARRRCVARSRRPEDRARSR